MKSHADRSPDDTASGRTTSWFSQLPARARPWPVSFGKWKELRVRLPCSFESRYVFSGSFTSTTAAFTALEFYTILYAVGHCKKKKKKQHCGENSKSVAWKPTARNSAATALFDLSWWKLTKHGTAYIFQWCLCNFATQPDTFGLLSSLSTSFFLAPCLVTQPFPRQQPSPTSAPERTSWSSSTAAPRSWVPSWGTPGWGTLLWQDHWKGRRVGKGLEMELPQTGAGSCGAEEGIFHLAKLPELNRGSPTPANLTGPAAGRERASGFLT